MKFSLELIKAELSTIEQNIINSFNILEDTDVVIIKECNAFAELEVTVCGEAAVLTVAFPKDFPNALPKFFDIKNQFGSIPHKMSNGFICFTKNDSLIIDVRYPASVLLNCTEKVIEVIEKGIKEENKGDFLVEFEAYWNQRGIIFDIYANIDTTNYNLRELDLWYTWSHSENVIIISSEKGQSDEKLIKNIFHIDVNDSKKSRCIYIPLKEGTFIVPPANDEVWDFSTLKNSIFSNLSSKNKNTFHKVVSKPIQNNRSILEFIIIGLPISDGKVALIGYAMSGKQVSSKKTSKYTKQLHPFVLKPKDLTLYKSSINRWNLAHLINRTGGRVDLQDKHILIAGLGSIGSEVAMRFAKAGVKKLSLVDFDVLELDNIHRHALGIDRVFLHGEKTGLINIPKVYGVQAEINRKYPFTEVEVYVNDIISVLDTIKIKKQNIDLIVIAIGSVNIEMMINQRLMQLTNPPPTIYTWVEPLGIGGHTLITLNKEKEGCYNCLFKTEEDDAIYNRSAFAAPFQEFSKSITGCGSTFTPYNFLDSERSAMLTVESSIKVLFGEIQGNPLLSWKGNDNLFLKQGFKTTPRYSFTEEQLYASSYLYRDVQCPICSNKGRDNN